jgi:hypothetical protein
MGYIEKLEQDFKDGKISKEEFTKSKVDYYKNWGGGNLEELEKELKETKSIKEDKAKKNSLDDNLKQSESNSKFYNEYSLFNVLAFSFYWFSKVLITYSSLPSYFQDGIFLRLSMEKLATISPVFIFALIISGVIKIFTKTSFSKILFYIFLCTILFQEFAINNIENILYLISF